jgi:ribonuclease Z
VTRIDRWRPSSLRVLLYQLHHYWGVVMKTLLGLLVVAVAVCNAVSTAHSAPCLIVTLTGSGGGPPTFNGLAGPGTLVQYGDENNNCNTVRMQFDAGRGTNMRLSQIGVGEDQLTAIFFTHMHTDHTEGFADILQLRWHFHSTGPKIAIVCSSDIVSQLGFTISCKNFVSHIADPFIHSGEIAQRLSEVKDRLAGGPADLTNVITFEPKNEPEVVWSLGDVKVSAIRSTHMDGHASYRDDTSAGSVVIGGDSGSDTLAPPRSSSTSEQVEKLAKGADIIVQSAIHPVMGPDKGSGMPPLIFYRQSTATDIGAMAKRAGVKHVMLTHIIPMLGAERQAIWTIPGGPLSEADYVRAVQDSGFANSVVVGTDLASIRLPTK